MKRLIVIRQAWFFNCVDPIPVDNISFYHGLFTPITTIWLEGIAPNGTIEFHRFRNKPVSSYLDQDERNDEGMVCAMVDDSSLVAPCFTEATAEHYRNQFEIEFNSYNKPFRRYTWPI